MIDLKLVTAGNPDLYKPATVVTEPNSEETRMYILEMERILKERGGLALAAPQIGIPYQIIIMKVPQFSPHSRYDFDQDPDHTEFPKSTILNPSFEPITDAGTSVGWESCLSLPFYRGKVKRHNAIKCTWINLYGEREYVRLNGFNARVFQHEYDHLQGITYIQRIEDLTTFTYIGETL